MVQRVMTTGGYPTKLPDADEISQDVSGDLMKREISVSQLTGISSAVKAVLNAQSDAEIRQQVGIVDSGIAVKGDTGQSAYQLAQQQGFTGTLDEWLESLHGDDGKDGSDGQDGVDGKNGSDGSNGANGKSAYEIAVDAGYSGTEAQWLASLEGSDGKDGSDGQNGADGKNGIDGTNGTNGKDGVNGTNGKDGVNGKSAYEVAVANGYAGTLVQWLASLKGADGTNGANGTNGKDGVNATTTANATSTAAGLMSSTDKSKLDAINTPVFNVVASGGRPVGTAFTIDASKNARVSYTISYTLTATLTLGQTFQIVATVDGKEVSRMADGILLGLAGNLQKTKSFSFDVPAGKSVLLTKSGTSSITATVVSGQEVLY